MEAEELMTTEEWIAWVQRLQDQIARLESALMENGIPAFTPELLGRAIEQSGPIYHCPMEIDNATN